MLKSSLLTGTKVRLSALIPEIDGPLWSKWRQNSIYSRLLDLEPAILFSARGSREWIEKQLDQQLEYEFEIRLIDEDRVIGSAGLEGNLLMHHEAFLGIGIGEPSDWGQGYGTEAVQLILDYAFLELNLERVSLNVFSYNGRAISCYEKIGFSQEGCQRGMLIREGQRWDLVYMGILRDEWLSRSPGLVPSVEAA
jgi:RimJ/RimL family protein N-acetyltransferase